MGGDSLIEICLQLVASRYIPDFLNIVGDDDDDDADDDDDDDDADDDDDVDPFSLSKDGGADNFKRRRAVELKHLHCSGVPRHHSN